MTVAVAFLLVGLMVGGVLGGLFVLWARQEPERPPVPVSSPPEKLPTVFDHLRAPSRRLALSAIVGATTQNRQQPPSPAEVALLLQKHARTVSVVGDRVALFGATLYADGIRDLTGALIEETGLDPVDIDRAAFIAMERLLQKRAGRLTQEVKIDAAP